MVWEILFFSVFQFYLVNIEWIFIMCQLRIVISIRDIKIEKYGFCFLLLKNSYRSYRGIERFVFQIELKFNGII